MNIFDPNTHIQSVVIVGCGGTGAQVARIVGRVIYDMRRARLHTPKIILIDPDVVEEKNVGRQLFTSADAALKLPKVEVALSQRTKREQVVKHGDCRPAP